MPELNDHDLLASYAREGSEAAFAKLVERHVSLVYSVAWRVVTNGHAAEEITQAVFIILAQKAGRISPQTIISGWLHETARLTAANYLRGEIRRQKREQEAYMQSTENQPESEVWPLIAPQLDEALGRLSERDRNAIVLRYFENKSLREVGAAIGAKEDAAKMRVNRALERLRRIFSGRGITFSAGAIAGAVAANSVQAAPAGLSQTISAIAVVKGAAAGSSTLTLVKGAVKIMAWTKAKSAAVAGAVVLLVTGTTTVTVKAVQRHEDSVWDTGQLRSAALSRAPQIVRIIPTRFPKAIEHGGWVGLTNDRKLGMGMTAEGVVLAAYDGADSRTLLLTPLPKGEYDFIANLSAGSKQALQAEAKARFGVVGRFETVTTNVLFLQVKTPNAPGLRAAANPINSSFSSFPGRFSMVHMGLLAVAQCVEDQLRIPVLDQTGIAGIYDLEVKWDESNDPEHESLKQALNDQLGLELVPGTAPVRMLVVEKIK
jgi:uncharacterized protein (TIGR03435 family)